MDQKEGNRVGLMETRDRDVNMAAHSIQLYDWRRGQIELVSLDSQNGSENGKT